MITRFAPSPTGPLHLGHAYSAMLAYDMAQAAGGRFLLRIEDIDQTRARPAWETQIYDDLVWLGLRWDTPVMRQSEQSARYQTHLNQLLWDKFLYVCTCRRKDIHAAVAAPQEGEPRHGPDGVIYPGTCRNELSARDHYPHPISRDSVYRLDWSSFPSGFDDVLSFVETGAGPNDEAGDISFNRDRLKADVGDIVIARRDQATSYHLSVVADDAAQGVTHVVRGQDLFEATYIHVALQKLLGLPTPIYHHHHLIRDDNGKRLAKRDDARALSKFRAEGATPNDIRRLVGFPET